MGGMDLIRREAGVRQEAAGVPLLTRVTTTVRPITTSVQTTTEIVVAEGIDEGRLQQTIASAVQCASPSS